jgi:hypothetical protein
MGISFHILSVNGFTFRKGRTSNPACSNVLAAIGNNAVASVPPE